MDVLSYNDYKKLIKERVKEIQVKRKGFTLKKLAAQISIQNTYLSRVLNDENTHLSEDHLFALCRPCGFTPEETEYICLLRSRSAAADPERKQFLEGRLERMRKTRNVWVEFQDFETTKMRQDMRYLFDPLSTLIHVSLDLPGVQKNPMALCSRLGIPEERMKEILRTLVNLEFIELEEGSFAVKKILKSKIHYGTDHPLMRVHQNLLKTALQSKLLSTSEEEKKVMLATFTADPEAFQKIKEAFSDFLSRVEEIAKKARPQATYQMGFDLFRWV